MKNASPKIALPKNGAAPVASARRLSRRGGVDFSGGRLPAARAAAALTVLALKRGVAIALIPDLNENADCEADETTSS
ncbi:MAG TPA: hypothetical protein PLV05_11190 [Verrucomicrobiota bacterium]|nr:hypothetical protein [Verrucomicrobiota bacterium]HRR65341.1 hypothetical protein [Candidatus Paceibacterota bacterium]MBP8015248.1 hypothetical protein [Verrucomicrobiota bacterium]MDI9372080.1 hypothetical protein [Verrucomicrobiota bacterium]NLH84242.1 hypothetical protein [Verrucomicrobiota bacterium]